MNYWSHNPYDEVSSKNMFCQTIDYPVIKKSRKRNRRSRRTKTSPPIATQAYRATFNSEWIYTPIPLAKPLTEFDIILIEKEIREQRSKLKDKEMCCQFYLRGGCTKKEKDCIYAHDISKYPAPAYSGQPPKEGRRHNR